MGTNLLSQGFELLIYGMGTVVVFLTLLVFATRLMSLLIQRFVPEAPVAAPHGPVRSVQTVPASAPSPELLAAIAAAVHQHRQRSLVSSASDID